MAEKIEKTIPWLTIAAICVLIVFGVGIVVNEIVADTVVPSVTVTSAAPTLGAIILNEGNDIGLTENTSVYIIGTTTVTDSNGYEDIASVTSTLLVNNTTTGCASDDANWCYNIPNGTASSTCATTSCSGNSCTIFCGTYLWFVAEPTDASGTYPAQSWEMVITVLDKSNNKVEGSTTQEVNILPAIDLASSSMNYGSLAPLGTSSEQGLYASNTGNLQIDFTMLGESMATDSYEIDTGRQKYSTASDMLDWTVGTALASTSAATWNLDLPKPNVTTTHQGQNTDAFDIVYWQIKIPDAQDAGVYSGTTTLTPIWTATTTATPG